MVRKGVDVRREGFPQMSSSNYLSLGRTPESRRLRRMVFGGFQERKYLKPAADI